MAYINHVRNVAVEMYQLQKATRYERMAFLPTFY